MPTITWIQDLGTPLFQCRSPQMLMPKHLTTFAGTKPSTSWGQTLHQKTPLSGCISPPSAAQEWGSTLPAQPFGHDSVHTRGAQAVCHHQIASEKTGLVAFEKPLKSSFSIMWFKMLFSESNESTGCCSSGNQKH